MDPAGPDQVCQPSGQAATDRPVLIGPGGASEEASRPPRVAAYRASIDAGRPLSERKLAAKFGKTSRRWARSRMSEARDSSDQAVLVSQ